MKLKEMRLVEGGNVFNDLAPIKKEYVPELIKRVQNLMPRGIKIIPHIGSAGYKIESGDMDVFVDAQELGNYFKTPDEKATRLALKKYIDRSKLLTALSGRNVHVRMPTPGGYGQVDIMVIPNAKQVAQFHQHGLSGQYNDPEFKGGQLFILYSSLAKALGLKFSPFEGKLIDRATNKTVADDRDSMAKILLNPEATGADLASIKSIMIALRDDPKKEAKLAQAREDAKKGLIKLPESKVGTGKWFKQMLNEITPPEGMDSLDNPKQVKKVSFYPNTIGSPSLLGKGSYGAVFSKKSGFDVSKIGFSSTQGPDEDGYTQFLKFVAAHPTNPHLPKIHSVKYFKLPDKPDHPSKYFYYVNLEKLFPIQKLNDDQFWALLKNTVTDQIPSTGEFDDRDSIVSYRSTRDILSMKLARTIKICIDPDIYIFGDTSTFTLRDKRFEQLLNKIGQFKKEIEATNEPIGKHSPGLDVHEENIMVRMLPSGPMLVITDPFA